MAVWSGVGVGVSVGPGVAVGVAAAHADRRSMSVTSAPARDTILLTRIIVIRFPDDVGWKRMSSLSQPAVKFN
mgnify:CR=1 FL=1